MNEMLFTQVSGNRKVGPLPVSTSHEKSCPSQCPFVNRGCFARYGILKLHWDRLNGGETGMPWKDFVSKVQRLPRGQYWRHNQAGDLRGDKKQIDTASLKELTAANKGKKGWTYTHYSPLGKEGAINRAAIKEAVSNGFVINLSGNTLEHADKLKALGVAPVVVTLPKDAPNTLFTAAGHKVIVCPSYKEGVTCSTCRLCAVANRSVIVGFRAHGSGAKYVDAIAAA